MTYNNLVKMIESRNFPLNAKNTNGENIVINKLYNKTHEIYFAVTTRQHDYQLRMCGIWRKERRKDNILKLIGVNAGFATTVSFFVAAVMFVLVSDINYMSN